MYHMESININLQSEIIEYLTLSKIIMLYISKKEWIHSLSSIEFLNIVSAYTPEKYFCEQKKCKDCDKWIYDEDEFKIFVSRLNEIYHYLLVLDNYPVNRYNGEIAKLYCDVSYQSYYMWVCRGYRLETVYRKTKYRNSYKRKRKCTRK